MNLKPELLQAMVSLGVTGPELELLSSRMLSAVTSLQAQLNALDTQLATIQSQRDAASQELAQAQITVSKLIETGEG